MKKYSKILCSIVTTLTILSSSIPVFAATKPSAEELEAISKSTTIHHATVKSGIKQSLTVNTDKKQSMARAATRPITYEAWATRGIKYYCWSKNTLEWTCDSTKIINYDAWQEESGMFINNQGYTKLNKSTNTTYYVNFKNKLLAGAELGGVTIGYTTSVTDQAIVTQKGTDRWRLNI